MFRGLSRSEHNVTLALATMLLLGVTMISVRDQRSYTPVLRGAIVQHEPGKLSASELKPTMEAASPLVDLNTASEELLELLPGVGPSRSQAIVRYRTDHGAFTRVEDLLNVPGFGEKSLEALRPLITVGSVQEASPPAASATPPPRQAGLVAATPPAAPATPRRINLNTATAEELEELQGVGPALAKRIIEYRSIHGPFRTSAELVNVKGIGPKILEQNRDRLGVN